MGTTRFFFLFVFFMAGRMVSAVEEVGRAAASSTDFQADFCSAFLVRPSLVTLGSSLVSRGEEALELLLEPALEPPLFELGLVAEVEAAFFAELTLRLVFFVPPSEAALADLDLEFWRPSLGTRFLGDIAAFLATLGRGRAEGSAVAGTFSCLAG